jgi:hypothetical protein
LSKRTIRNLIVHHSVSSWGDGDTIMGWHTAPKPRGNGWRAPGYHVVICNGFPNYSAWSRRAPVVSADGRVDRIWPEEKIANGCRHANADSLHVCLIGDFDKAAPTERQMEKLTDLLAFWCKKYGLDPGAAIFGHGEMQRRIGIESYSKSCPGKNVSMNAVRAAVALKLSPAEVC